MSDLEMSAKEWQTIHKTQKTDVISMIMDYKHGRINQTQLADIIEAYVQQAYELGISKGFKLYG